MARDYFISGECLVRAKGAAGSGIANLQELGLSEGPITVTPEFRHRDIQVNAWGDEIPPEVQFMLSAVNISMNLVHFDRDILDICLRESMGGAAGPGTMPRAGTRLGNGAVRFAATNHFIGLNLTSPVGNKPWRFLTAYLSQQPMEFPLGTERSVVALTWRAIPYSADPWNNGNGAAGAVVFDHTADA